ncbi:MAG: hypothetical protein ACLFP1_02095 [Candidatus Goldiibacteriota bacterium]
MKKNIIFNLAAVVLVFLSAAASFSLLEQLGEFSISSNIELMFFLGFAGYLVVHIVFYKPVFVHVMAHELTHILWAMLFGGRAKKLEISGKGGKVLINRSNFLISLAPYFFPLYTVFFMIIFLIAKVQYHPYIAFFIGASFSFHIALTLYSMRTDQSDFVEDSSLFFSLLFIYFMNVLVIALLFSVISPDKFTARDFAVNVSANLWDIMKFMGNAVNEMLK